MKLIQSWPAGQGVAPHQNLTELEFVVGTAGVVMGTAGVVVGIAGVEKLGRDVNNTTGIKLGGSSKLTE